MRMHLEAKKTAQQLAQRYAHLAVVRTFVAPLPK